MPARITIDENGYVVSVESLPTLKSKQKPPGRNSASKSRSIPLAKKPNKTKATKAIKPQRPERRAPQITRLSGDGNYWILCPVCGVKLLEKNLRKHQRKTHAIHAVSSPSLTKTTANTPIPKKNKKAEKAPLNKAQVWRHKVGLLREKAKRLDREIRDLKGDNRYESIAKARELEAEREEALRWLKYCSNRLQESAPATSASVRKPNKKKSKKAARKLSPSTGGKRDKTGKGLGLSGQALHQSFEDSSYAGRGLGHMRRENGRFGSLPLYDDYGEESGAD